MKANQLGTLIPVAAILWVVGSLLSACGATESPAGPGSGAGGSGGAGGSSGTGGSTNPNDDVDDDGDSYTENEGDCNDGNPDVSPEATEICDDGIDNNCNGATDEGEPDGDGDGFGPCQGDCDDTNPDIHPAAAEVADGFDNNCDGIVDGDYDGDGFTEDAGDCDDGDPNVYPGAIENCYDGVDNDCNGHIDTAEPDGDNDGFGPCQGDCNDGDPNIGPNQPEIPNDGIDNNCDNLVDLDIDGDGWTVPNGDCDDTNPNINPSEFEDCNDGIDNNCDGLTDQNCMGPCELAELQRSSVGCTYFAVDQDNYTNMQYAVAVSNVDANAAAAVEVQQKVGNSWQTVQSANVAPMGLHQFNLPNKQINATGLAVGGAYKIVSDLPVIAYEFNPIDGQSSATSDASLLLPTSALDSYHYIVGWEPQYGNPQLVVVAAQDGTSVTVTPTASTLAGGGLPALTANVPHTFTQTLNEGDYLQVEANASLNGTYITSTKPVAVFSAHDCANIPVGVIACDHLEEQIFGLQTWGKVYVGARMPVRDSNAMETTLWHIIASEASTQVSFSASPQVTGLPSSPQMMNAGQVLEMWVSGTVQNPGDFVVTADKPILVAEYLTGRGNVPNINQDQAGDPAMTQVVPVEQFLDNYVVLVPGSWVLDFVILTKPIGSTITLDSSAVAQSNFVVINDGVNPPQWEVARVPVTDGVHTATGTQPFGIVVVGYDFADSYAYPGGLDQQLINPIN